MMTKPTLACFDDQALMSFLDEQTPERDEASILSHLDTCDYCRDRLETFSGADHVQDDLAENLREFQEMAETLDSENASIRNHRELSKVRDLLAPTERPEMLGRLGNYEVCGVIGRGSAGIVVKALDPRLNRFVAIKLLAPSYSNNGCSRRRFEREGRAIASVKDPHVVPIHAVDEFQGTPYIVMQYLPDGSLFQRIKKHGPMTTEEVTCVGLHIARGLAAAHSRGIVHRDVKPANVLLENGLNNAMVTDFGLARVVDEATMTRSGSISGTPQYMSPEQAKGERVDARSDLFSLGSVMFTACTGQSPFQSGSVFGVIKKVCESEPEPIYEYNSEVAEWMVALIEKLHQKEPADRFESADQVAEVLSAELAHLQSPARVAVPNRDWWTQPIRLHSASKPGKPTKAEPTGRIWIGSLVALGLLLFTAAFLWMPDSMAPWSKPESNLLSAVSPMPPELPMLKNSRNGVVVMVNGNPMAMAPSSPSKPVPVTTSRMSPKELLVETSVRNQEQKKYTKKFDRSIVVKPGGKLTMRTNLGGVFFSSHDQPTVEMRMIYTVGAESEEIADKLFKAMELDAEQSSLLTKAVAPDATKGRDAVIVAKFPFKQLTSGEIQQAEDLEELKEQLLIRNNSHYKNVEFHIQLPKEFDVDLQTGAGPIFADDIQGTATMVTKGGEILLGNVTEDATLRSSGGSIEAGDIQGDAFMETNGGHVDVGDVGGGLTIETHGGHIEAGNIAGQLQALTHGGHIEVQRTADSATATSNGGSVTIRQAQQDVHLLSHSGPVRVNFVDQPTKASTITSHVGAIRIGCVSDVSFKVEAEAQGGSVRIDALKQQDDAPKLTILAEAGAIRAVSLDEEELEEKDSERAERNKAEKVRRRAQRVFNQGYEIHMDGRIEEAIHWHRRATQHPDFKGIATYNLGCAYALLGKKDDAFKALEDSVNFGFLDTDYFDDDSDLDSLRKEPRFEELKKLLAKRVAEWNEDKCEDEMLENIQ